MTKAFALCALVLAAFASPAGAAVIISDAATSHMICGAGVCKPTARRATLNTADLANMLSAGDVTVETAHHAVTITVLSTFSWTSASRLTLDAEDDVSFRAPMAVAGPGAVTIATGPGGDLVFFPGGSADFWDTSSVLTVNGTAYTLVADIRTLAADIAANDAGAYALAANYDASADGTYVTVAVPWLNGSFEGLGHTINKLSIKVQRRHADGGMFEGTEGTIRDIHLTDLTITQKGDGHYTQVGGLLGQNDGTILRSSVRGMVKTAEGAYTGGLAGYNGGTISLCSANVTLAGGTVGGLVGENTGLISQSWAAGSVTGAGNNAGGLVGFGYSTQASVLQSYSTAAVETRKAGTIAGGLAGAFESTSIAQSYAAGAVSGGGKDGGFIGYDGTASGMSVDYWDLDTSGISDPSRGAGNIANDPGITGLTTAQFQSGQPAGFDPAVWGQSAGINNGFPYLIANPPQ